jgi:hypothetical protein
MEFFVVRAVRRSTPPRTATKKIESMDCIALHCIALHCIAITQHNTRRE